MTQQPKKTPAGAGTQTNAKIASTAANKAARTGYAAIESTRASAENVVKIGTNAVRELIASGAGEAQKAQEKAFAIGRESAENFAKTADTAMKVLYECVGLSRDNIEACMECSNITSGLAKELSTDWCEFTNKTFSDNVDIAKEAFTCRTLNDVVELQNKLIRYNLDSFFEQSAKISNMFFEYASEAIEPINERIARASDQMNKVLAA